MNGNFISLANLINNKNKTVKISDYDFCEPSFLLWILSLHKSKNIKIDFNGNILPEIKNYLNRISFFEKLGIKCSHINRKKSDNLVEITPLSKSTSWKDTNKIAKKLIKNIGVEYETKNKYVYGALEWIFWELIDNSIQHSKSDFEKWWSYFMLQSYLVNENYIFVL